MISHTHKFIFVHIRKTAGTSVTNTLGECEGGTIPMSDNFSPPPPFRSRSCTGTKVHNHANFSWYKEVLTKEQLNEYFKFTFVRNPWDLRVSQYEYNKKYEWGRLKRLANKPFKEWVRHYSIKKRPEQTRSGLPQIAVIESVDNLDFIGRFENLQEDFDIICDKIGIPKQQLPHVNKTKREHYTEYYDDETKQIVAEKYAKDIEYFGYEFGA